MNCHACGNPVAKGEGFAGICMEGLPYEVSSVLIHNTEECKLLLQQCNSMALSRGTETISIYVE